jgi:curved DNA-binding protein CbpA
MDQDGWRDAHSAMNYYEILGVNRDASTGTINQAYRSLARKVHPDLNDGDGDGARADARMKQLNEIRDTLTDSLLRSAYDERLRRDEESASAPLAQDQPIAAAAWRPGADSATQASVGRRWRLPLTLLSAVIAVGVLALVVIVLLPGLGLRLPGLAPGGERFPSSISSAPAPGWPFRASPDRDSTPPRRAPGNPQSPAAAPAQVRPKHRNDGVVFRVGSTAADVLRALGQPDRVEHGVGSGDTVMIYGTLRIELRKGVVVGGNVR